MYCAVSQAKSASTRLEVHRRALDEDADGDDGGERSTLAGPRASRRRLGGVRQIEKRRLGRRGLHLRAGDQAVTVSSIDHSRKRTASRP